jgi:hypothetical protein
VLTRRRTVAAAQTVPALHLHLRTIQRSQASEDPLGQLDTDRVAIPYLSSPSISSARAAPPSASVNLADALLETYDKESQLQLLRSHYCRSEVCTTLYISPVIDIVCTDSISTEFRENLQSIVGRAATSSSKCPESRIDGLEPQASR